jgi:hypothetical protein
LIPNSCAEGADFAACNYERLESGIIPAISFRADSVIYVRSRGSSLVVHLNSLVEIHVRGGGNGMHDLLALVTIRSDCATLIRLLIDPAIRWLGGSRRREDSASPFPGWCRYQPSSSNDGDRDGIDEIEWPALFEVEIGVDSSKRKIDQHHNRRKAIWSAAQFALQG